MGDQAVKAMEGKLKEKEGDAAKAKDDMKKQVSDKLETVVKSISGEVAATKAAAVNDLDTALKKSQEVSSMISSMKDKYNRLAQVPSAQNEIQSAIAELKQ